MAERKAPDFANLPISDLRIPGMMHAVTIRSPVPRGRLLGIEVPRLGREFRLIGPEDIPGRNAVKSFGAEIPVLSGARLHYQGEPVALLAGPDPDALEELRDRAIVRVEAEEPFLDFARFSSDQVVARRVLSMGDPELAFSVASRIVEGEFQVGSQEHWYAEPQGAFASFDYDKLLLACGTQWPYHVRDTVAEVLGVKSEAVTVKVSPSGPHLDGRLWYPSLLAAHAALAARLMGKPVLLLLSRAEDFRSSPKRSRFQASYRAALGREGELSALEIGLAVNVGAYGPLAEELVSRACLAASGVYACPNLSVEGYAVSTDTPPLGALAGIGDAQAFFAIERVAEAAALAAGRDPMEWRERNILRKGSSLPTGGILSEDLPFAEVSRSLREMSDFDRKRASFDLARRDSGGDGPFRGIGVAFARQAPGAFAGGAVPNSYAVEVELDKSLKVSVRTSAVPGSPSVMKIWRERAAEILGLSGEDVEIKPVSTDSVPNSGPSTLSRNISVVADLIERACATIKRRRFREALPIVARSAARVRSPVRWTASGAEGDPFDGAAFGGAVVEVELDAWSLEPRATGIWIAVAPGRLADEAHARRAMVSGSLLALAQCAWERLDPSPAGLSYESFAGYRLMPLCAAPPVEVRFVKEARKSGARGIGELPFDCVPAAYANAVSRASGLEFGEVPIIGESLAGRMSPP